MSFRYGEPRAAEKVKFTGEQSSQFLENTPSKTACLLKKTQAKAGFLKEWWFEILAGFTIILSLMAIALTLALNHDKPLEQWPFIISINAVVAIFTVVLKASMLTILAEGNQVSKPCHHS